MRNELNDIEKIERYLRNEMSADEKLSFEKEMEQNPSVHKRVEEQRELLKGLERMKMKKNISSAKFKYKFWKGALNIGIPVIITTALTALIINYTTKKESKPERPNSKPETKTEYSLPKLNETGDSLWADADKYIPYQIYSIDNSRDTVIVGEQGMVIAIPANGFVDENGNPVKGKIDFELKEALNTETILKGGLSTYSNGELLETGGMFYINARQNGKSLKIAEGKNIYADVPSDPDKKDMLLFNGERKPDGSINWINPKSIEKPLVTVDIHTLNFYPPLYEDSLAKMGKDVTNKKYKDSLYYSFAGRLGKEVESKSSIYTKKMNCHEMATENYLNNSDNLENKDEGYSINPCLKKFGYSISDTLLWNQDGHMIGAIVYVGKNEFLIDFFHLYSDLKDKIEYLDGYPFNPSYFSNSNFCRLNYVREYGVGSPEGYSQTTYGTIISKSEFKFRGEIRFHTYNIINGKKTNIKEYNIPYSFKFPGNPNAIPCQENLTDSISSLSGLNPAKVKSIWNDKFQNTLIATKEFEERMPHIHKLCNRGNNVLDIYVKNLDKKMCTIDSMVANTLSGSDKEQFLKFAARGEGKVKTEDNCLKKLGEFYDEQTKIYMEAAKKTAEEYYTKNKKQNEESDKRKTINSSEDVKRKTDNFNKEFTINVIDAYRQIGKKPNIVNGRVRLSVGTTGWKNLDRYVLEATINRETMVYTDPDSGKKAILKYEPLEIKINSIEKYDRVLVYLLPDQLNSFMRMNRNGNIFSEKLNMLFKHELVILAYKGDKSYFKYYEHINPGIRDSISLEEMSEKEINVKLISLKKLQHKDEMQKDILHQFFLQADAKRRKVFLEKEKFIRRIEMVIFPCGNVYPEMPEVAPTSTEWKQEY